MKTKEEIVEILKQELPYLKKKFGVKTIGIFGSCAREEAKPESDIDILIEIERPMGFFTFLDIEEYLTKKLGMKVDLVTPDALKPLIKPHIMEDVVYA